MAKVKNTPNTLPMHHTHLRWPDFFVPPLRCEYQGNALAVWWPPQCPCAHRRTLQGMGQDAAASSGPWRGPYTGYVQCYCSL